MSRLFGPDGKEQPLINGNYYSFGSIEVRTGGRIFVGITEISYGASMSPGEVFGIGTRRLGRTPGVAKHRCSFQMYRGAFDEFLGALGDSYGRKSFQVDVTYTEQAVKGGEGQPEGVTTDSIIGCRIVDLDLSNQEGTDPLSVKVTLDPSDITIGKDRLSIDASTADRPSIRVEEA